MLFGRNFYLGLLKIILQNFFFIQKSSVTDHLFVPFFWGKKSNWTNSYQNAYTQDFINVGKSFISNNIQEKWDGKVPQTSIFQNKCYFSIFFALFLRNAKKCAQSLECYYFYEDYFWMLQFTDRFSSLNHQAYWKKKSHTHEEGGEPFRISFWHLLMNLKKK